MKIVSWNCNGALRKKLHVLRGLDADVYIVQECEDPKRTIGSEYAEWACNYLWIGENKNKGLGVFAKSDIALRQLDLDPGTFQSFLPCALNDQLTLLAVWTKEASSPTFPYIGQMWRYLQEHKAVFAGTNTALIGDFNSNVCWDKWDRWWNHSDVVRELAELDIFSLYHTARGERQGSEIEPTYYMHRKREKPYHIDYAFVSKKWLPASQLTVGKPDYWLEFSDHMPLIVELNR